MKKPAIIKHNLRLLAKSEPEVKDNYNLLVVRYWMKFELASVLEDVVDCTPAESITRAFRSLVHAGEIELTEEIKKIRRREEQLFEETYRVN